MDDRQLSELSVGAFLERLASGAPTPGGGSAASLAGAFGAALVSMVCNLTIGRQKFAAVEAEVRAVLERSEALRGRLLYGASADAAAYAAVMDSYRLPRETEEQKAQRQEAIQSATREAARVPLEAAEDCASVIALCEQAVGITNPNAASDVAVAALLAAAGLEGSIANVEINLSSIKDVNFTANVESVIAALRQGTAERVAAIQKRVRERTAG